MKLREFLHKPASFSVNFAPIKSRVNALRSISVQPGLREKKISLQAPTPRIKDPDIQQLIERYAERTENLAA